MVAPLTRGLRNHNPLNIRRSDTPWRGKVKDATDKDFEQFVSDVYGVRAALVIMRTYISRHHLTTPAAIITRWAPATENNTRAYISAACTRARLQPSEALRWKDKNKLCRLAWAMAYVECGQEISFGMVENAYEMANS